MAYEGVQTRHRSLEEQVQQLRENHQQTTEELRQALTAQNQALTEAITNAITDLSGSNTHVPYVAIISSFDGTNPLDWLFQAEKYFSFWDIAEEQRIDIASFYMVGQALSWFQWMHKNQQLSSWRAFTIALEQRFGPSTYVNHRAALFKLTQRTTVAAYQSEFETLSNRVTNLPPEALLDCFISGLKSSIQSELAILKPTTLSDAIALAKLVEDKFQGMRPLNPKPLAWKPPSTNQENHLVPRNQHQPPLLPLPAPANQKTSLPIKRLTAAEIQARRAQGLCYNYDERYRPGHRCRTKPFLLLLADDSTDAIEEGGDAETVVETCEHTLNEITTEPEPEISLHALEGITGPRTFRLHASINRQPFTTLIDTGSSHNYLQPRLANFLHLPIDRTTQFPVVVGNGEKIHSEGTCPHVKFEMQGAEFEADFHVLEFAGADAILGIQWLEGLGKVVTDHKDLTMEFEHKGKPVKLIGRHTPTVLPITCHQLMRLQQIDAMAQCFLLAPHPTNLNQLPPETPPHPQIQHLLNQYSEVFSTPKGLPPDRILNHKNYPFTSVKPGKCQTVPLPPFSEE
nr:uncharacterized protein LOC107175359 [Ipomoea trifida]